MKTTLEAARQKDKRIKMEDVKTWFNQHVVPSREPRGYNSWIVDHPRQEYQSDLFFFGSDEEEYKIGLIVIDAFTKEITVFLLKNKSPDVILPALEQAFKNLGGTPEIFHTDDEGAYNASILKLYFEKNNIKHIITRKHAPMAEVAIKTIKNMLYKRMKRETTRPWYELVHEILFVINYMRKHSSHGMTPKDARKPENHMKVQFNLEKIDLNIENIRIFK
jgi:transposase InsO family protein